MTLNSLHSSDPVRGLIALMIAHIHPPHSVQRMQRTTTLSARESARTSALTLARTLAVALAGGALFKAIHAPLPWMLGPLIACALANMRGAQLRLPAAGRNYGQWVIGTVLGLYFTPPVLRQVLGQAPWIALGVLWAIGLGLAFAWSLRRFARVSRETAFFAGSIGGASEMALLGERAGARVDQIAASHSLRITLVVLLVPMVYRLLDLHGSDPYQIGASAIDLRGLAMLTFCTLSAGWLFRWRDWPNAWVLGPLAVTIVLTGSGQTWSAIPAPMIIAGQLAIGASLGSRFTPEFFEQAPQFLMVVAATTLTGMAVTALAAWALSGVAGIAPATLVLATAPGGIAEMSLTAKTLQLGVPVVTAFHVIRLVAILTLTPRIYRLVGAWRGWRV